MNTISIKIETTEKDFEFYLANSNEFTADKEYPTSGEATIVFREMPITKSAQGIITFVIDFVVSHINDVTVGLFTHWLYNKLEGKKESIKKVEINRREVQLDEGEIKKIIEEEIKITEKK